MDMKKWAKREIELACKSENPNRKEYESALKAFESLCEDGHSMFSINMTKHILNRLIEGKPLTPITEENADWDTNIIDISEYGVKCYQ